MIALLTALKPADWLKFAAGAVLGALLCFGPIYLMGKRAARSEAAAYAAKEAIERINEMEKNNANFRNSSDHERCVIFMRDSGLPVSECD